jgi:hypothetical protein
MPAGAADRKAFRAAGLKTDSNGLIEQQACFSPIPCPMHPGSPVSQVEGVLSGTSNHTPTSTDTLPHFPKPRPNSPLKTALSASPPSPSASPHNLKVGGSPERSDMTTSAQSLPCTRFNHYKSLNSNELRDFSWTRSNEEKCDKTRQKTRNWQPIGNRDEGQCTVMKWRTRGGHPILTEAIHITPMFGLKSQRAGEILYP